MKDNMRRRGRAGNAKAMEAVKEILARAIPSSFPERLKLKEAAENWKGIVGAALAARSAPADIADGELLVFAETPLAAQRLSMMGGNIVKALAERLNFSVKKVRVVVGSRSGFGTGAGSKKAPPQGSAVSSRAAVSMPELKEAEVKDLARRCLELSPDLPGDAAESFAGLQLFFAKRFRGRTNDFAKNAKR